jgi:signal peptidase I
VKSGLIFHQTSERRDIAKALAPSLTTELIEYLAYFITIFILVSIFYSFVRFFAFDTIKVSGLSMTPTHASDDLVYIDLLTPKFSNYRRGEIVVLKAPSECDEKNSYFIKRIIGLPGEKVVFDEGNVFIQNKTISDNPIKLDESNYLKNTVKTYKSIVAPALEDKNTDLKFEEKVLETDEYFFMGDNRTGSVDARKCGPISKKDILGREFYTSLPETRRGFFNLPKYNIPNQ